VPLQKQSFPVNFSQGLDLKTDPYQVQPGKFLALQNSIFDKGGLLQKRNGYGALTTLPDLSSTFVTTFNDNLLALGNSFQAYSQGSAQWVDKGGYSPVQLTTLPLIRSNTAQTQVDSAVAANGIMCTVYTDNTPGAVHKYAIADSTTGQNIVPPTVLTTNTGTPSGSCRVFLVGAYFLILFTNTISGINHLQYIAINTAAPAPSTNNIDISSLYTPASTLSFDGCVVTGALYVAWAASDGSVRMTRIGSTLFQSNTVFFSGHTATLVSVTADTTVSNPTVWVTFYSSSSSLGYTLAVNSSLITLLAPTLVISGTTVRNLTSTAQGGVCTFIYEVINSYGYDASILTDYLESNTISMSAVVGTAAVLVRSVGLASKAVLLNGVVYVLTVYNSAFQPSYFLINGTGKVVSELAYSNGGGYYNIGLPNIVMGVNTLSVPYLIKDLIQAVNKLVNAPSVAGIYSQTGLNLVTFTIGEPVKSTAEIGSNLNAQGGFLWSYDGYSPVENGFFLWPDYVEDTVHATGGGMAAQKYYYQATYEWTDNQGNVIRSAPSIPVLADLSGTTLTPITFTSVFASGATSITASSTAGLQVGQVLIDTGAGVSFQSVFASGDVAITASSVAGLEVGQTLTDTTTSINIQAGTYITSITGNVLGLSLPTAGNSAASPGDTLQTPSSSNIPVGTYITSITGSVLGLSAATTGASAVSPGDTIETVDVGSATIHVPTIRLTYKISNPVKIVLYRWSTAQQNFFQTTSTLVPVLNDPTVDYVTITDTNADAAIIGNSLIYTTGGVVEDISPPSADNVALFQSRLFMIDAEDKNLLWFSKQVIEATPVEMSDLLTIYVAPTTSAQGNTGPMTALSALDDKLIVFKKDAIYYINGQGPDNTGANNQFSDPVFVTSTVGCANQKSIVFMPDGLMFQSDKGIWLLGRDLGTNYIGAPVQQLTLGATVQSAVNVPGTNQVRFTLDTGVTLMYDYYYKQWGSFTNIPAISSTLYNSLHTYINAEGGVFQETPGFYIDGSNPVLMNFTTAWFNLAGLQGYERAYFFYLLGTYITPHKLTISVAYDYNPAPTQTNVITPDNFSGKWGGEQFWGSSPDWGGNIAQEPWRVFLRQQKCQAFQISVQESYDPSYGVAAGAGLTMSGLNVIVGMKKSYRTQSAKHSVG
jgi:hypothetical protein